MKSKSGDYSYAQITEAYRIAAKIVVLYGDRYLPIFQRVHLELEKFEHSMAVKDIALNVASAMIENDK